MAKNVKTKKSIKTTKTKKKKTKHVLGPKEFLFNFFSLVLMIGVGVYFGYRSLYYYSKQNQKIQAEAQTLNGIIIQNTPVVTGDSDGFHHDTLGYYYKGQITNNYVSFGNRLFRIMRINEDSSVRLISENAAAVFPFGNTSNYSDSNIRSWLEDLEIEHTGFYSKTLPSIQDFLVKTEYQEDLLKDGVVESSDFVLSEYVTTLTVTDYILANGMNSYLNTGVMFFLLGHMEDGSNLYIEEDGSIQSCNNYEGYGIRPVITLKPNSVVASGSGTKEDPYLIDQTGKTTFVESYVKLGDDTWKVFSQEDGILKLSYNGYAKIGGAEIAISYSQKGSFYDIMSPENIGYYLNNDYLSSLPYQDILVSFDSWTGEVSEDRGYHYPNMYADSVNAKVGLLNIFDYIANPYLTDYYHCNTASDVGSMQYITYSNGLLGESDVREIKHVVPVVAIFSSSITGGSGSEADPYVVG